MAETFTPRQVRLVDTTETQLIDNGAATNETHIFSISFHNDSDVNALAVDVYVTDGSEGSGGAATAIDKKIRIFLEARETFVYDTGIALVGANAQVRVVKTAGTDPINIQAETVVYS